MKTRAAALRRGFFLAGTRQFFADRRKTQSAFVQNLSRKTFFFAQQSQQQMFGADVLVRKAFRFFGRVREHALAFVAQRQVDRSRNLFADGGVSLDLLTDRFHRRMRAQKRLVRALSSRSNPSRRCSVSI